MQQLGWIRRDHEWYNLALAVHIATGPPPEVAVYFTRDPDEEPLICEGELAERIRAALRGTEALAVAAAELDDNLDRG